MDPHSRVVVLIDMDCFYCQVEEKLNPELKGKPIAVVQYNPWKGGGIIAVNYVARDQGVTRHMRGDEAKEKCPDIQLPSVPCQRGKADISKYREAGKEVARVLQKFTDLLERASIDEAYLDISASVEKRLKSLTTTSITAAQMPNTYALGYDDVTGLIKDVQNYGSECLEFDYEHAARLLVGAIIVSEIRAAVYDETGYRCSAGIAHNKILAKLVCGMNKPNKQTVLPKHCVNVLYSTLSLKKVKHLGGKFGDNVCSTLNISKMAELQGFTEKELQHKFDEKNGTWLYNIARGINLEPVQARFNPKSIGCCKQFKGKAALLDLHSLRKWLKDLGDEIEDRLEKDALESNRTPKQMVVSFSSQLPDGKDTSSSRSYNFVAEDDLCGELFSGKALELVMESVGDGKKDIESNRKLPMPIKFLGISVGKFEDHSVTKKNRKINDFFGAGSAKGTTNKEQTNNQESNNKDIVKAKLKPDKEYILEKFLQGATKTNTISNINTKVDETTKLSTEIKIKMNQITNSPDDIKPTTSNTPAATTTLEKQESFFAKFLNQESNKLKQKIKETESVRPTTPICKVVECGDNSNDSDYSSSTINAEINKSISLFEDSPADVARVTEMRNLLATSNRNDLIEQDHSNIEPEPSTSKTPIPHIETYECDECKKQIPILLMQTHADYHLALKLRDEERQIFKKEKASVIAALQKPKLEEKPKTELKPKPELNSSIANFLVKVDETTPLEVCSHCKKRVPLSKLPEHLDFHEAQKLSRELNKKPPLNYGTNSVKRKRKSISPEKKSKVPCKPISSFFVNR